MELALVLQAFFALVFVIALIGISALLYRKYVLDKNILRGTDRRLKIEETLYLDSRRRLVLVKKDEQEIVILIGTSGETVIQSGK